MCVKVKRTFGSRCNLNKLVEMIKIKLVLLFFLFWISALFAQNRIDFDKLSIDDGFTSSKANAILQDNKGFIWIGTWNGLNRYDGYQCEIFRPSYHDSTTISNREVVELMQDHQGNIWIGTSSGLNCLDPSTKKLKRYPFENRIIALHEDHEKKIWIGTWNGGLYLLDPESGKTEHFLANENVSDIHEDSRRNLWIATYYGLINFDRKTGSYVRYLPNDKNRQSSVSHSVITQICESDDSTLWLGTWGGGLNRVYVHPDKDQIRFVHYRAGREPGSLSSNVVYRLYYDHFGNLWIGTWSNGLNLLSREQQKELPENVVFQHYQNDLSDPYSLSGNNISSIFVDRSGILWVGSSKINKANIIKTGIARYKTNRIENGRRIDSNVRSFAEQDGKIWIGTSHQLMLYEPAGQNYKLVKEYGPISYLQGSTSYLSNSVLSLASNNEGLWIGTEDAGLVLFKEKSAPTFNDPEKVYFNQKTGAALPGNKVGNLCCSSKYKGVIWIGTMQTGFAKLTYTDGQASVKHYSMGKSETFISDNNIRAVLEDQDGLVWIGTQNGLNCFDPETETFRKYFYSLPDMHSINDNVINCLLEDSSGDMWIGTNAGLNKKKEQVLPDGNNSFFFEGFPSIQHLKDEIILNILESDSKKLWLVLYRGMVEFDVASGKIVNEHFTKEFQNIRIERNSALKTSNGDFLFGGGNGFIVFHPDSIFKHSCPPDICLTDVMISNESIEELGVKHKRFRVEGSVPHSSKIRLSHKDRVLTFVFSAMDFKNPGKNNYAYFLEGFDKEWNQVGSRNTATYTSIPHGKYKFLVKAANSDGVWSAEKQLISLSISPPWWKTLWAYLFYFVVIMGLLYFFKEYSIIQVREKGRLLIERMQKEEAQKLDEMKSRFFTDITHEFRTPLTLILGPAEEIIESKGKSNQIVKQAELIQRNAQKLLRLVNQLMEFRKVEKGKMEFLPQETNMVTLLNEVFESFRPIAVSKNIEFELVLTSPEIRVYVDPDKIEKVLFNLVSNAFKYSEDGGRITIRSGIEIQGQEKKLVIEVEDTGIGISEENKEKVFERFFQTHQKKTQSTGGIGLYLTRAFVEQHQGIINVDSELGKGTCFKVLIPVPLAQVPSPIAAVENKAASAGSFQKGPSFDEPQVMRISGDQPHKHPVVLIAEDDHDLNHFIVDGLKQQYHLVSAFNGKEALEQARKQNPDMIVSDIMMPEMDGFELCRLLRKELSTSHIPIIFLTAKTMHDDEIKGLKMGAVDYICKPFNLMALKLKIQNILDNQKIAHEKIKTQQLLEPENIELSSLDEVFLKNAVETVNRFLDDPVFDVERFSHEMGISPNQAYRKIKALTGQTAKEFIRNQRLKTAANMLLQKKRTISEVIYMVGFSSPSYFARCFKEYYGFTPKEYVEKIGEGS